MSSMLLQSIMGLQSGQQNTGSSDMASKMLSSLDTDGDGTVSLDEAKASGSSKAGEAFAALDLDGDGSLTADELSSTLSSAGRPPGGPPPGRGGPPPSGGGGPQAMSSADIASQLLSDLNTDGEDVLSLDEVGGALGDSDSSSQVSSGFSKLDTDGDGKLSLAELTTAIESYTQSNLSRFAAADGFGASA